jgi:hypothetical protein
VGPEDDAEDRRPAIRSIRTIRDLPMGESAIGMVRSVHSRDVPLGA